MSGITYTIEDHKLKVQKLASDVRSFYDRKEPFRIFHGSSNTTRRTAKKRTNIVDTSALNRVISVDAEKKTAMVEPNVSQEDLLDATLAHGLLPLVVMEFPAITVGGAFAGTAGESSSYRYGLFNDTVNEIEIVLGDGTIVQASPHGDYADLYHGAAGSHGTLGVLTLLTVQLRDSKSHVQLTYHRVSSAAEAVQVTELLSNDVSVDYLDGILFSEDSGLIISGCLTNSITPGVREQRYLGPGDPWFYTRAKEILHTAPSSYRESTPLRDYIFRYDRGGFWAGVYCFDYFMTPFNSWTRWALDSLLRTKTMYHALHKSGLADQYIVQDISVPHESIPEFVAYLSQSLGFFPLWLCPLRILEHPSLRPRDPAIHTRVMNVGLWGPGPKDFAQFVHANRKIEQKTRELHGLKCLYAHAYYTEDEFWSIYDKNRYDGLRRKYRAESLPSVYEKVSLEPEKALARIGIETYADAVLAYVKGIWPVRGVYGALHAIAGQDYLLVN